MGVFDGVNVLFAELLDATAVGSAETGEALCTGCAVCIGCTGALEAGSEIELPARVSVTGCSVLAGGSTGNETPLGWVTSMVDGAGIAGGFALGASALAHSDQEAAAAVTASSRSVVCTLPVVVTLSCFTDPQYGHLSP
jgi:hypothetical protein